MTTTVSVLGKDFVVLAADKLASVGDLAFDVRTEKILKISDRIAITTAGAVGDAQILAKFLSARIKRMKIERGEEPSVNSVVSLLSLILNSNRLFPYLTELIVAGYVGKPFAASVDPIGGVSIIKDYSATGSGSPVAFGVLEDGYSEDIVREEAVRLAVRAVEAARRRNVFTGGREPGIDVAVIDEKGIHMLSPSEVVKAKK